MMSQLFRTRRWALLVSSLFVAVLFAAGGFGVSACASSGKTAATPSTRPPAAAPASTPAGNAAAPAGRGTPPPPPPPPPAVMPKPVTPIVSDTAPTPDPRVGLKTWPLGRRASRMEHAHDFDDAADREDARVDALGSRVRR